MVDTYRAQIKNTVVLKMARRPSSALSAIGEGMQTLGGVVQADSQRRQAAAEVEADAAHQVAMLEKRRQRAAAVAAGAGALADMQISLDKRLASLPERAAPGSQGYAKAAQAAVEEEMGAFLATLPKDDEVRQHFAGTLAQMRVRAVTGAQDYEDQQFAKFQGDSYQKLLDVESNKLFSAPTGAQLVASLQAMETVQAGMNLDGTRGPQLAAATRNTLVTKVLDGLAAKGDFGAMTEMLNGGSLDSVLVGDQKKSYLRLAGTIEQGQAREAELKAEEGKRAALDQLKLLDAQQDGNQDVTASQWQGAIAAAQAAGVDPATLQGYLNKASEGVTARQIRGLSTGTIDARMRQLQAQRDAGKLNAQDAAWLDQAEKEVKARGGDAGAKLKPLLTGGIEARLQGLGQLHAMPLAERWRAAEAAGDPRAAIEAGMPAEARAWAVQGAAIRVQRKDQFLPAKAGAVKDPEAEANRVFDTVIGADLKRSIGPAYLALRDTALNIMAARSDGWNPRDFGRAVQMAFGMTRRASGQNQGGLGTIRGRTIELPEKWTQGEFDQRLSRYAFEGAVYASGQAATAEDVRRHFRLEVIGVNEARDTLYRLIGPDGRPLARKTRGGTIEAYELAVPERPR